MRGPFVQDVVGDGDGPAVDVERMQVVERVLAVVAAYEHLEQRFRARDAVEDTLAEEADDAFRNRGQRVHARGPVGGVRVLGEVIDLLRDAGEHVGPLAVDDRLVEPPEAHAAGEVADRREAQLGGHHDPVEQLAYRGSAVVVGRRLGVPAAEQRRDDGEIGRRALLGQEDAEHGRLELRRAFELGDAVVRQHAAQLGAEQLRQAAALDVEGLQVAVEVLARAVHPQLRPSLLVGRSVAAELGEVGEHAEQADLALEHVAAAFGCGVAGAQVALQGGAVVAGIDVVAEQHRGEVGQRVLVLGGGRGQVEVDLGDRGGLDGVARGFEPDQRRPGLDLAAGRDVQLADGRRERRVDPGLHLHRLEHQHRGTGRDLGAHGGRGGDDERRRG